MSVFSTFEGVLPPSLPKSLKTLPAKLQDAGATLVTHTCHDIPPELITLGAKRFLVLDFINDKDCATQILQSLQHADTTREIPVFALVKDDAGQSAEYALALGAADFIAEHDSTTLALQKIKTILGEPDNFSGTTEIDITPVSARNKSIDLRVFVVEDDSLLRNLLSTKLEASGCTTEFSVDGANIPDKVQKFKPDIIILDLLLPGIHGLDILAELKNDDKLKNIPVVIFSNNDDQDSRKRASELGAAGFFVKAMTELSALLAELERLAK